MENRFVALLLNTNTTAEFVRGVGAWGWGEQDYWRQGSGGTRSISFPPRSHDECKLCESFVCYFFTEVNLA